MLSDDATGPNTGWALGPAGNPADPAHEAPMPAVPDKADDEQVQPAPVAICDYADSWHPAAPAECAVVTSPDG